MTRGLSDTTAAAEAVQLRVARELSPSRKLAIAAGMSRALRQLALAGIRSRFPEASPEEVRRRLASLMLPPNLARLVVPAESARGET